MIPWTFFFFFLNVILTSRIQLFIPDFNVFITPVHALFYRCLSAATLPGL